VLIANGTCNKCICFGKTGLIHWRSFCLKLLLDPRFVRLGFPRSEILFLEMIIVVFLSFPAKETEAYLLKNVLCRLLLQIHTQRFLNCCRVNQLKFSWRKKKLHGLSPLANCTDGETAACRRSDWKLLRTEGARRQRDGSLRPYSRFSRQDPLLFYQVAFQLYSRGWVDPVPDSLLFSLVLPGIEPEPPDL
jgi:hypothetical protein